MRRDLDEDDEYFFMRDLDAEELFGREYDLLDERATVDNEDLFVRDLDAIDYLEIECRGLASLLRIFGSVFFIYL